MRWLSRPPKRVAAMPARTESKFALYESTISVRSVLGQRAAVDVHAVRAQRTSA